MKKQSRSLYGFYGREIGYSVLLLVWIFLPLLLKDVRGIHIFEFLRAYSTSSSQTHVVSLLFTSMLYLVIGLRLIALCYPFSSEKMPLLGSQEKLLPALLDILASSLIFLFFILHLFEKASSVRYFKNLSVLDDAVLLFSFFVHGEALARAISLLNRRQQTFREYLEYRRNTKGDKRGIVQLFKGSGIQKKLIFSFVGLFLVIIGVLSSSLLADFRQTILKTVIFNGNALTERTASIIKANIGDEIAINDYFAIEKKKRVSAPYGFNTITFYRRQGKVEEFIATNSTEEDLIGELLPDVYRGAQEGKSRYNEKRDTYEFLAPVVLSRILIGYVLVDYDRALIYEPYFRTQVKVIAISVLFLYLSVFLIYVFGMNIVLPILFLRMGVNKISKTLSGMIRGKLAISSDLLMYRDTVRTKDEIKDLSGEIHNMTVVIRGIIPYISASTLKHAEKEHPNSQARELAFLFTDILGFTSICEGLEPEQVVDILNRYLELQATIIQKNEGDIDKFVGDEIMAMFEGPEKELNACRASMEIRTVLARENELKAAEKKSAISIGIGIHAGPVVFGSVGARHRMDFTSIGDTVNLAARLEGVNRVYGTKALVTENVHKKIKNVYLCREIDFLTVKGKRKPVRIFEILQEQKKAGEKLHRLKEQFENGLGFYRQQRWDKALDIFGSLSNDLKDEASEVFIHRIHLFKPNPPPKEWDGVFNLTSK
jgi:class 3 adenylate cyclase